MAVQLDKATLFYEILNMFTYYASKKVLAGVLQPVINDPWHHFKQTEYNSVVICWIMDWVVHLISWRGVPTGMEIPIKHKWN